MRRENTGLAIEAEDRAVDVRFPEEYTGIVGEVACGKVVGAIDDNVVWAQQGERILAQDASIANDNLHVAIDPLDSLARRQRLGPANIRGAVDDLALEVRKIHRIEVQNAKFSDAGCGEIHGDR